MMRHYRLAALAAAFVLASTVALAVLLAAGVAFAADLPGSKDPPFLKRYKGSEIVYYLTRSFDQYGLVVPDAQKPGETVAENHEGAITRIYYAVPAGHTALELLRNYEQAVKESSLAIVYELSPCKEDWGNARAHAIFGQVKGGGLDADPFVQQGGSPTFAPTLGSYCFFTAKGAAGGQDIALTVEVVEVASPDPNIPPIAAGSGPPTKLKKGQVLVGVDVVATKAVENQMVVVKAADMADALATKGKIDLYGIYFDTDKAIVKPESKPTLDEVANLLKIDRSLKLEVAGHTDNTGDKAHNRKLSEDRAKAVVDALVKTYSIDAARLLAKGYGDTKPVAPNDSDANRAKNRRVELRKL